MRTPSLLGQKPVAAADDEKEEDEARVRPSSLTEVMAGWNTGCILCRFQEGEEVCFCNIRLLEQKVLAVVLRDKRQTAVTASFENQVADMPTASPLQSC